MKRVINLCIFLLIVLSLSAQNQKVHVLLKNGSRISGTLIESESDNKIRVESKDYSWMIPQTDIDTVLTTRRIPNRSNVDTPWFFKAEYGVLKGSSENEEESISFFHGLFNYHLDRYIYGGGGLGVEYYQQRTYVPTFANFELRFRDTKFTPYFFVKAGYLIPADKQKSSSVYDEYESRNLHPKYLKANGGVLLSPGIGIARMFGPNFGMSFSAAYRYHETNYSGKEEYELEQRYNRLALSLGIIFK